MHMIERIKTSLLDAARNAYSQPQLDTDGWTREVSQNLLDLGQSFGFKVCVSRLRADNPEWLYDMVWYTVRGEGMDERLDDVPMVMECEWHSAPVKIAEDFEKLLVANAPLKVMVCYPKASAREYVLAYFRDSIEHYKQKRTGDKYLIALLRDESEDFHFETIIC